MDDLDSLASLLTARKEYCIFRRFLFLHNRNLLLLQTELSTLEAELIDLCKADREAHQDVYRSRYHVSFRLMLDNSADEVRNQQLQKMLEIRVKLRELGETQLLVQKLYALPPVRKLDLDTLRGWFQDQPDGHNFLSGREAQIWRNDLHKEDLTSLNSQEQEEDALTRFITERVMPLYHRVYGHKANERVEVANLFLRRHVKTTLTHYSDRAVAASINAFSTILSSLWPTVAVFTLYYIRRPVVRLAVLGLLTFVFSATLTLIAGARKLEVFAATAAYAAVLVVFVSNNNMTPA